MTNLNKYSDDEYKAISKNKQFNGIIIKNNILLDFVNLYKRIPTLNDNCLYNYKFNIYMYWKNIKGCGKFNNNTTWYNDLKYNKILLLDYNNNRKEYKKKLFLFKNENLNEIEINLNNYILDNLQLKPKKIKKKSTHKHKHNKNN